MDLQALCLGRHYSTLEPKLNLKMNFKTQREERSRTHPCEDRLWKFYLRYGQQNITSTHTTPLSSTPLHRTALRLALGVMKPTRIETLLSEAEKVP